VILVFPVFFLIPAAMYEFVCTFKKTASMRRYNHSADQGSFFGVRVPF
jgi:hypothetical protein